MKASALAPSNIAFTKYWGRKDEVLRLPENGSIAMALSDLITHTTVQFDDVLSEDSFELNGEVEEGEESRVGKHLDRIRKMANIALRAKVVSTNNFPTGTGLSSSASGFAALTAAGAKAAGLDLNAKELSILARQGSGSACRSIPSGIVEWRDGNTSDESFAETIFAPEYWPELRDIVAIVSTGRKEVSTSEGQKSTGKNPFFPVRVAGMKEKNERLKEILSRKNFKEFGELVEQEALELHAMMFTSGLIYLQSGTIEVMRQIKYKWRPEGLAVYFTINTGQDIHLICEEKDEAEVQAKLKELDFVRDTIVNKPGKGAHLTDQHLF